jgi:two-component system cell cycle sensor histidine kinase/response regulator CckA
MNLDNREFIARHHKNIAGTTLAKKSTKKIGSPVVLAILAISLYFGFLLFVTALSSMGDLFHIYGALGVLVGALIGLIIYRSYTLHIVRERKLELIQEVLEGSRGGRLITDSADNTIYTNQKFDDLCKGLGPPAYKTLVALFQNNEEALSHFALLADQAHRGLTDSIELFSKLDDRECWYAVTAQPVAGWAGYIHWRVDDVTQKYTVDRAIREEREKLIDFTDNAPVGFFSVNEDGRFVFANATFARWMGQDLDTLMSTKLHTYLVDPPLNGRPFDLVDNGGARQVLELRMKGPGGRTFLAAINQAIVYETGGQVRTRAVVHDLTSEREMRQALEASEDRFQRFFEEAPLGIILVDENGMIKDCNSQFASILGCPMDDLQGVPFADLIQSENKDIIISTIKNIGQGLATSTPMEVSLARCNSEQTEAQMHARRFRESGSVVLHFIDLRQQKALEAQFVQSQKMQAVGQLAGGIAHDFNNLLTAMIGFCDLLLLRHKPGDPSFGDIMQIKQNSNRAANLVRQLLAFSRQQTLRPKVQDITDILTELSHLLRRLIGAGIELEMIHGAGLNLVKVDGGQMEQVLINLAVNARDAMNGSGKLVIATRNFTNRKPRELVSEVLPPGHWSVIDVTDTGSGIPKENMTRIFEPFFTTKEIGHGTGLGLATVYGIIRQTDGFLDVQSTVGQGTTFTLYLPRASEIEEDEPEAPATSEDMSGKDLTGTERILLVEDEDAVRTFGQRALTNKGYVVLAADSGESALKLMEQQENKHIDLLVTDVVMPIMDGPTLAQRMRQSSPGLRIVFMSGYTEDRLKDHMGEGIYFLPKPFTLKQLAEKVKEVLGS